MAIINEATVHLRKHDNSASFISKSSMDFLDVFWRNHICM